MFRKLPTLIMALLLVTEASLFPLSAYSENPATPAIQGVTPLKNKPPVKTTFSDKADNEDGSIRLSKATSNEEDSCFPILYGEKETISLDFQNANIRNLFRIISEFSGFNVIFSPEVQGSVNIRIYDMPWNQALEIILSNSELGRECFGNNVVRIANRETLKAELAEKAAQKSGPSLENSDSCFPVLYGEKEHVSLDFQNAHLSNLFRIISEVSGFNLILSQEVSGSLNIRMLDVPWNHALEIILANSALGRECFVKGTVRIANKDALNKAPKIAGAERGSEQRLMGKELKDIPPVAMALYKKIQSQYPELLKKMHHFESIFRNSEMLQAMSDEDYKKALADYKDILKDAAEIKMTKTPLQKDYQSIHLTGVISIKKEKVALFETLEKQGYSVRKGDIIGPNLGSVDDIQFERVIVVEKARDYLGNTLIKKHPIVLFKGDL
jgi:Tfp pilus assembly protein PilP